MKKWIAILAALALMLCGLTALAESEYTYDPAIEDFVGTWYADDCILEIVHSYDDNALLNCIVTQYGEDHDGVRWIYDSCSYDDVGKALTSLEIGIKTNVFFDDNGDLVSNEDIYTDGAASFAINDDGTLTWTDYKETPGENELVFEKVVEDAEIPEAAFEGTWESGRATITIESLDDVIYCDVHWSSSYNECTVWNYDGLTYDAENDCLVSGANGVKRNLVLRDDGEEESSETVYEDGTATFRLDGEGRLIWEDGKENAAEDMLFEKIPEAEEDARFTALIDEGDFVIQVAAEGDLAWIADDMAQDASVVRLASSDTVEDTFVARYTPVGNGDVTVGVRHYAGIACDEYMTWDLHVADGAVQEVTDGAYAAAADDEEIDPILCGEWLEQDTQFTQLTIEKNPERGWDVTVISPISHGAYVFQTTVQFDCELESFVYDKGKFWDLPTDYEEGDSLGEAKIAGTTGEFILIGDEENPAISWFDDEHPEETITFDCADS